MKSNKNLEKWADDISETLVVETFKLLGVHGKEAGQMAFQALLSKMIGVYTHQALTSEPDAYMTKSEKFKYVSGNFADAKDRVGYAVSVGVAGALKAYSGKEVEYYCVIKTFPEVKNSQPC